MALAAATVARLRRRRWRGGRAWRRDDGRVHHDAHDEPLSLLAVARLAADEAEEARAVEDEPGGAVGEGRERLRGVAGVEGGAVHQEHRVVGVLEVCDMIQIITPTDRQTPSTMAVDSRRFELNKLH